MNMPRWSFEMANHRWLHWLFFISSTRGQPLAKLVIDCVIFCTKTNCSSSTAWGHHYTPNKATVSHFLCLIDPTATKQCVARHFLNAAQIKVCFWIRPVTCDYIVMNNHLQTACSTLVGDQWRSAHQQRVSSGTICVAVMSVSQCIWACKHSYRGQEHMQ